MNETVTARRTTDVSAHKTDKILSINRTLSSRRDINFRSTNNLAHKTRTTVLPTNHQDTVYYIFTLQDWTEFAALSASFVNCQFQPRVWYRARQNIASRLTFSVARTLTTQTTNNLYLTEWTSWLILCLFLSFKNLLPIAINRNTIHSTNPNKQRAFLILIPNI